MIETKENTSFWAGGKQIYRDAIRALMLDDTVYREYAVEHSHPMRLGFKIIFFLSLPAVIGTMVGLLLDYGTLPQVNLIQDTFYQFFTGTLLYEKLAMQYPVFGSWFAPLYSFFWYVVRAYGGYPSVSSFFLAPLSIVLGNYYIWWIRSLLLWNVAKWLKGSAPKSNTYITLSLAVAPQLFVFLNIIPGFTVPAALLSSWGILMQIYALRQVYGFSWARSIAVIIATDIFLVFFLLSAVLVGVLVGVLFYNLMY